MSEIKIINTSNAPAVFGPFSQGVKTESLVFTTGQLPIDPATGKIVSDDVQEQTRRVLLRQTSGPVMRGGFRAGQGGES